MPKKPTAAKPDPAKPLLDGQHEEFAQQLAFGKCSVTEAYSRAGFCNHRQNAGKVAQKYYIPARVEWLKANTATKKTLTVIRKREKLCGIVEKNTKNPAIVIKAIEVDNTMDPDFNPKKQELSISGEVTVIDRLAQLRSRKYVKK